MTSGILHSSDCGFLTEKESVRVQKQEEVLSHEMSGIVADTLILIYNDELATIHLLIN